ncbi:Nucleoporin NDC1 [Termitomyces sp. T112]|nr:Nucleoporin NDC1 [Termitomyces sp. T112]
MKATRAPATSLSALVKSSIAKPAATNSTLTYALSAVAALVLHVGISYVSGNGAQGLTIFVKSKKHPFYLNGRLLFVVLSQIFVALAFSLRNITLDRFVFRWVRESTTRRFNIGDIVQSIVIAALLATLALSLTASVFGIIRLTLPLVYKLPLLRIILRPFTAHFLRGPWTIFLPLRHVSLLIKSWFLGFTTLATWEFSNEIFDTFVYNPLSVIGAIPEPHVILVSGVSSTDLGFRYLAYKDILRFSSADSEPAANLRSSLFNDQKYNPNLWSHLVRESLLFLGKDYQHFLHRGKPAPAPPKPATPAAPVTPSRPSVVTTQAPLIRTSIFKSSNQASPMRNVMESLGSDGALVQALDAGTAATHIPALFKSVGATVLPAPKEEVKKRVEKAEGSVGRYVKQAKEELRKVVVTNMPVWVNELGTQFDTWWNKERLEKIAQSYLPNAEVDVVIVDVLSTLVCASLKEDRFGVVQRDIPRILEAMLSFLSAIQAYHFEVRSKYVPPIQDQVYTPEEIAEAEAIRVEVEKACDVLDHLSEYLRAGIARIVRTFGDKLLAFKFPPRTAEKLQPFIEYC